MKLLLTECSHCTPLGTKSVLVTADDFLNDDPRHPSHKGTHALLGPGVSGSTPTNTTEGLQYAYESLSREMRVAADSIITVPLREYQRTGTAR